MAIEQKITPDNKNTRIFTGEDKTLRFTIYERDEVTPQDVSTFQATLSWMLKRNKLDADANAKIVKLFGSGLTVVGIFNVNPALNTQRVEVVLEDTETALLSSTIGYYHELKRTDLPETVLSFGDFQAKQAVHR